MITELPLVGAGGEPVDFRRTLASHGVASLPPSYIDEAAWTLDVTLPSGRGARTVRVSEGRPGYARVEGATNSILVQLRHMFRLDEDLSVFYTLAREDPELAWAAAGAGRMLRSPTVFEDVVKTICTTNCAWGGTVRMVTALVDNLGVASPAGGRTFPRPAAMADAGEEFYRDFARAGYRGAYLRTLAEQVASRALDLERLNDPEVPDEEVEARLLALPGRRPVRRRTRDADVARPLLAPGARLVDPSDLREARRPQGERQDDRAQVPPLRRLRRPCVLASADARLGPRRPGLSHKPTRVA